MTGAAALSLPLGLPLAFLAGLLTFLSPCVLPLVPVVLGAAGREGKAGPFALAAGLVTSFTIAGALLATAGVGASAFAGRVALGLALVAAAAALLVARVGHAIETALGPVARWASARADRPAQGIAGQFALGLVLGLVWSPCVGPTLGAASALAARGENLPAVATTMLVFAVGASLPLIVLQTASRATLARMGGPLRAGGRAGRLALGASLLIVGAAIATGLDHAVEATLVVASPDWLVRLTTSY